MRSAIIIRKEKLPRVAPTIFTMVKKSFVRDFDPPTLNVGVVLDYLKGCYVYMVYNDSIPIGYFGFKVRKDFTVELRSIALVPEYQHKGIGAKMIGEVLKRTKGHTVMLVVHPPNSSAILCYLKAGFKIVGWKSDYFGDGKPRLVLEI